MTRRNILTWLVFFCATLGCGAQDFYNLTADEVSIDSVLPQFRFMKPLGAHYADSVYTLSIDYPDFIDMSPSDVSRYLAISSEPLPQLPIIEQYIGVSRRQGTLYASFVPLVCRDGKYQKLVSFRLSVKATPRTDAAAARRAGQTTRASEAASDVYADHSVLASGQWAKIRVPSTGIYQLTEALVRKAGFQDVSKVKVYGYGGAMQPERLTASYLATTDDLQEVPQCVVGGKHLFHAVGPVSWSNSTALTRTRNPYSDFGYYFLTTDGSEPLTVDSATFVDAFYPSANDYHSLYEVDDYAWFTGGRNLFDAQLLTTGNSFTYTLPANGTDGRLTVVATHDAACTISVAVNDSVVGTLHSTNGSSKYVAAASTTASFVLKGLLREQNTITLTQTTDANARLDYLSLCFDTPQPAPSLAATFTAPEFVYRITNQDHHADGPADMVIIIPTSQKLLAQAQRLATYHEQHDSLRTRIVPADELYNEFASGTPDANAYRRYLRMLYDSADTEADMPRYLLLFGDAAWDNRLRLASWSRYSADDFLLCYESENSFSETTCYVSDDYFCLLDEGEGGNLVSSDKSDVAVGRFPVRTSAEARVMVDKAISYMDNRLAGSWQNVICMMGDDGNDASDKNGHMATADKIATMIQTEHPGYNVKKVYWDAYTRTLSSTGASYPDVERILKEQMRSGALVMNYSGHGAPYGLSHEFVLRVADFATPTSLQLPLWLTASCDIMPFDGYEDNIGETAILNPNGGAIAFYGTTRTVYAPQNEAMNLAFMHHVLSTPDGRPMPIGEAARLAKTEMITSSRDLSENKLQYTLLGDPALRLALPTLSAVVETINGQPADGNSPVQLSAGSVVTVEGRIEGSTFDGMLTATVLDSEETITCKMNNRQLLDKAFVFTDRPNTIYSGTDSVRQGRFTFTFAVPSDIKYADGCGQILLHAVSTDHRQTAHGEATDFVMQGDSLGANDGIGPSIYCYLNSSDFNNGGTVNTTPYFYATLTDRDGINASGGGIGHDLELCIDGDLQRTYVLNDYFQYDFGDYRSGSVGYSLPQLSEGPHTLRFRAWDIYNNSSTAELTFNVAGSLQPTLLSLDCTQNPATTQTTFIVSHDRTGSQMDVELDVFDTSGRQLWHHSETGVSTDQTYTLSWDLTADGGRRLQTGVYLCRVSISCDGSRLSSKARKLIVL